MTDIENQFDSTFIPQRYTLYSKLHCWRTLYNRVFPLDTFRRFTADECIIVCQNILRISIIVAVVAISIVGLIYVLGWIPIYLGISLTNVKNSNRSEYNLIADHITGGIIVLILLFLLFVLLAVAFGWISLCYEDWLRDDSVQTHWFNAILPSQPCVGFTAYLALWIVGITLALVIHWYVSIWAIRYATVKMSLMFVIEFKGPTISIYVLSMFIQMFAIMTLVGVFVILSACTQSCRQKWRKYKSISAAAANKE